jgi:hypothetical protein
MNSRQTILASLSAVGLLFLAALGSAQSFPPAWASGSHYAIGDQVQFRGNVFRAINPVSSTANPSSDVMDWELNFVRANTTLMVGAGQTFQTLTAAWIYAQNARVADGTYLHFYISSTDGDYSQDFAAPLLLDHNSGARIAILGDNAANIVLNFNSSNGIIVDSGHSLNTISAVTLSSDSHASDAIKVDSSASVSALSNVTITGFGTSIHSLQSASITVDSNCTLTHFNNYCALAENGGNIVFPKGITINGAGIGQSLLYAVHGGEIIAEHSSLYDFNYGAFAKDGGVIDVESSTFSGLFYGVISEQGTVDAEFTAISSCDTGCYASSGGTVDLQDANLTSNGFGVWADTRSFVDFTQGVSSGSVNEDLKATGASVIAVGSATYQTSSVDSATGCYLVTT